MRLKRKPGSGSAVEFLRDIAVSLLSSSGLHTGAEIMRLLRVAQVMVLQLILGMLMCTEGLGAEASPLKLILETGDSLWLGDPVVVTIRVRNEGSVPRRIVPPLIGEPWSTSVLIDIRGPDEQAFHTVSFPGIYAGPSKLMPRPAYRPEVVIPPHGQRTWDIVLDYDFNPFDERRRRLLFPVPGEYGVRVGIFTPAASEPMTRPVNAAATPYATIYSEPHLLQIHALPGLEDAATCRALQETGSAWLLYGPEWARDSLPLELTSVLKAHPTSRFADYARMASASIAFWQAVLHRDKVAAEQALETCRQLERETERSRWSQGWRAKSTALVRHLEKEYETLQPNFVPRAR